MVTFAGRFELLDKQDAHNLGAVRTLCITLHDCRIKYGVVKPACGTHYAERHSNGVPIQGKMSCTSGVGEGVFVACKANEPRANA